MFAQSRLAAVPHLQDLPPRLRRGITTLLVSLPVVWGAISAVRAAESADRRGRPNIVFILADDKYECPAHEAVNLRENRQITAFSQESQITGNCGEFRAIADD